MENWNRFAKDVLVNGLSQRTACAKYILGWHTLKKILAHAEPSGYRQSQVRPRRVLATVLPIIQEILEADQNAPKKQRHTVKRIFERLNAPVGCNLVHSLRMLGHVVALAGLFRSKKVITLPLHVVPHRTTSVLPLWGRTHRRLGIRCSDRRENRSRCLHGLCGIHLVADRSQLQTVTGSKRLLV